MEIGGANRLPVLKTTNFKLKKRLSMCDSLFFVKIVLPRGALRLYNLCIMDNVFRRKYMADIRIIRGQRIVPDVEQALQFAG